jgi:large-conductance mechanosensitive channel
MKPHLVHLVLMAVAGVLFAMIGRMAALNIYMGFATPLDYGFFALSLVMFLITWFMAFIAINKLKIDLSSRSH